MGLTTGSSPVILLSAAMALPSTVVLAPAYYVAYGLLALTPGATSSSSTGSGSCTPGGACHTSTNEDLAAWCTVTTEVIGVLALTAAALLDVAALRILAARRPPR